MSPLPIRACTRPLVQSSPAPSSKVWGRGHLRRPAAPEPRGHAASKASTWQLAPPRAKADPTPERSVFDEMDRKLHAMQAQSAVGVGPDPAAWATRMRSALSRYIRCEDALEAAARRRDGVGLARTHSRVRDALHALRNLCAPQLGRVPPSLARTLSDDPLWQAAQRLMAWRRRELVATLPQKRGASPPPAYAAPFDRLDRQFKALLHAEGLDRRLKAWIVSVWHNALPAYLQAERRRAAQAAQAPNLAGLRHAIEELEFALAQCRMQGTWAPGFQAMARAPRLSTLLAVCRAALLLRLQELGPSWVPGS